MNSLDKDQAKSLRERGCEAWFRNVRPRPATVSDEGSQKHSKGCLILATAKVISWKLILSVSIISYISICHLLLITILSFWGYIALRGG